MNTTKAIIYFDGTCALCNACVQFIKRNDPKDQFLFSPLSSLDANQSESVLLVENGKTFRESTAALRIAYRLKWPWKFFSILLILPRWLRDPFYRWIARNRQLWISRDT